jgi:hypothetical protein
MTLAALSPGCAQWVTGADFGPGRARAQAGVSHKPAGKRKKLMAVHSGAKTAAK